MPGSTRSNTLWLVIVVSVMAMLAGCDNVYQIEKTHDHPTAQTFVEATGHELNFDLYLPNSFTGWEPAPDNKFTYNPQTQSYEFLQIEQQTVVQVLKLHQWCLRLRCRNQLVVSRQQE